MTPIRVRSHQEMVALGWALIHGKTWKEIEQMDRDLGAAPYTGPAKSEPAPQPELLVVSEALCRNNISGFGVVCADVCSGCTVPGQPHPCEHALTVHGSDAQEILRALSPPAGVSSAEEPTALTIARNMAQSPDNWPPMRVKQVAEALVRALSPPAGDPVFAFLLGSEPLDGRWFGDDPPAGKPRYWWRKALRAALLSPPAVGDVREARNAALEEAAEVAFDFAAHCHNDPRAAWAADIIARRLRALLSPTGKHDE